RPDQPELVRVETDSPEGVPTPVFGSARQATESLARAAGRTAWLDRPPRRTHDPADLPGFDIARARLLVADFLAEHPDGGWLDPEQAAALLSTTGVRPEPLRLVRSAEEAAAAAREFAGPVAVKAYGPNLLHKRHAGALVLGVDGGPHAWQVYADLAARHADGMHGAVVQPMVGGDLELLVGVNSDSVFGPVIAFGLGGTEADALADRVVRLAPLDVTGAGEMLRGIRAARVLDSAADGGPVDIAALQDLLVRVSLLADRVPELADMDLNPVLARRDGFALVDVKVRLCPRQAYDPFLRRLR
ncbi:MAG TPA: acetate--CoA ligase family protein, partial [Actinopolymorphaceae bacterium]|nr:acetate--CoA ligase family protein [Actinopolymorphaceae bacterium]